MSDKTLTAAMVEMKQHLRGLATCLGREHLLDGQNIFYGILEMLEKAKPRNGVIKWGYSLGKTELKLDSECVRWPRNPSEFVCVFDLNIAGRICDVSPLVSKPLKNKSVPIHPKRKEWENYVFPQGNVCWIIDELKADLQLLAHSGGESKWEQFWHFDRHITTVKSKGTNQPLEIHPLFHFQFGGDRLAEGRGAVNSAWGNLLELHAPRISHPPLDLVLLIDFILANFAGSTWHDLVENKKEYHEIVEAAQRRFWCPYKCALADYFQVNHQQQNNHLARELWPSLARKVI